MRLKRGLRSILYAGVMVFYGCGGFEIRMIDRNRLYSERFYTEKLDRHVIDSDSVFNDGISPVLGLELREKRE